MKKNLLLFLFVSSINFSFSQNVGLGTPSPEAIFHLRSGNWIKTILENGTGETRGYIGTDNNGTVTFSSNAYWNGSAWIYPNSGPAMYMLMHQPNQQFEFRVRPDAGAQSTAMVIRVDGNVGIGTNTIPQKRLSVGTGMVIDQNNTNTGTSANGFLSFGSNSGEGIGSKRNPGINQYGLDFYSAGNLQMTITNAGNIGIGTIEPGQKLEIIGGLKIGNTSAGSQGSIKYDQSKFYGHNGTNWNSFDQLPRGTLAVSNKYPDHELVQQGYKFKGTLMAGTITQDSVNNIVADSWLPTGSKSAIIPYFQGRSPCVWTGNEMIIWGDSETEFVFVSSGQAYDPAANIWRPISNSNSPVARRFHKAVWTGTEMFIWGGIDDANTELANGGRYSRQNDNWSPVSTVNAPSAARDFTLIWTGTEIIIWGGSASGSSQNTGARYNPSTNTWTPISTTNAPTARKEHSAVWTGTEMIIWGGLDGNGNAATGGRYNPSTNTWTATNHIGAPAPRSGHYAVWIGTGMLIWGGINEPTGSIYNPLSNSWSAISNTNAPASHSGMSIVWTGLDLLVWGGYTAMGGTAFNTGKRYSIFGNSWTSMSMNNVPSKRNDAHTVWTGKEMIVFGGNHIANGQELSGGRYYPYAVPNYFPNIERSDPLYLYAK